MVVSEQAPQLKRATSMFVYSDIVELSLVGDTLTASLGFLPIQVNLAIKPTGHLIRRTMSVCVRSTLLQSRFSCVTTLAKHFQ